LEASRKAAHLDAGDMDIGEATKQQTSVQLEAVMAALRSVYWLMSEEVAHTTKYESLLELQKLNGCSQLHHLSQASL